MACVTSAGLGWDVHALGWRSNGVTILDDIWMSGQPGEVTALLGPNGSGKTSLLSILAGLRKPSTGRVEITNADGSPRNLHRIRPRERARQIALVEQEARTQLGLSVRDVVALGRIPHRNRDVPDHGHSVIDEAMDLADVAHLADRSWATLSGGERQRSQLARALAQQPALLLLDEPTNHLDLHHQIDFLSRVKALGVSTIAALHDLELAAAFCDRAVVLEGGQVMANGPIRDVLTAELLDSVYGVDGDVEAHPFANRPHIRWTGLSSRYRNIADMHVAANIPAAPSP